MKRPGRAFALGLVALLSFGPAHGQSNSTTSPAAPVPAISSAPSTPVNTAIAPTNAAPAMPPPPDPATLIPSAQAGDVDAEIKLYQAYGLGKGAPLDYQKAFDWAQEAAFQNNTSGESGLAWFYLSGKGVHHNEEKAFSWYLKAARQGDPTAERCVGSRYQTGVGIPRDDGLAAPWLRKAAFQGETMARAFYGLALLRGDCIEKNVRQGFAYILSSGGDFIPARVTIAECYDQGIFVAPDPVEAYRWCLLADQKDPQVIALEKKLKAQLSDAQLKEADAMNQSWQKISKLQIQTDDLAIAFSKGTSVTLPFKVAVGHIYVPIKVNGQEINFIVDTGCDATAIDERVAKKLNVTGKEYLPINGTGPDLTLATVADTVDLDLNGLTIKAAHVLILPYVNLDEYMGKPIGGMLGGDLLRRFIVQIDYVHRQLTLTDPKAFTPDAKAACLPFIFRLNIPYIEATMSNEQLTDIKGYYEIDTGDSGTANISKVFCENNPGLNLKGVANSGAVGLGGLSFSKMAKCSEMNFGGLVLHDPVINLLDAKEGAFAHLNGGSIGNSFLRRFDVTFDFANAKLYLKANSRLTEPFDFSYYGIHIKATGDNYDNFEVFEVVPQSPGSIAGVRKGDIIQQIDKAPLKGKSLDDIYDLLNKVQTHELLVRRDNAPLTLEVKVFDPFKDPKQADDLASMKPDSPTFISPIIEEIAVNNIGPALYPDNVIIKASGLKIGDSYLPYELTHIVKNIYATGMIKNMSISAKPSGTGVSVTLLVQAAPVVKTVTFVGTKPDEESQLRPLLNAEEGRRITEYEVHQDEQLIQANLLKAGRATVTVTSKLDEDVIRGEAQVTYTIN